MTEFQSELLNLLIKYKQDITTCSCCGLWLSDSCDQADLGTYESLLDLLNDLKKESK